MQSTKYINQLKEEKEKFYYKKKETESVLIYEWDQLKKSLSIQNIKDQVLSGIFNEKMKSNVLPFQFLTDLKMTLNNFLKRKLFEKIVELREWARRIIKKKDYKQ